MNKVLIVIPARYASTRFPGKPLAILNGKPLIQWVWESVKRLDGGDVIVATDDARICATVESFGGKAMMTSNQHRSGTDRCGEVLRNLEQQGQHYDIVINVQGDEPFTRYEQLQSLIDAFTNPAVQIVTLKTRIKSVEELTSKNNVKVVTTPKGEALYFSRQPIPFIRDKAIEGWLKEHEYYKHVGIYAFRAEVLRQVVQLEQTPLEKCESLEQLRWLENGYQLKIVETETANIGIDTPEDLALAEKEIVNYNF